MSEYGIDTYIGSMEYYELAPGLKICRILNGMWQVAGGHGPIDSKVAIEEMVKYHNAGFTTWDLADIYGPAEDFIGAFRHRLQEQERQNVQRSEEHTSELQSRQYLVCRL